MQRWWPSTEAQRHVAHPRRWSGKRRKQRKSTQTQSKQVPTRWDLSACFAASRPKKSSPGPRTQLAQFSLASCWAGSHYSTSVLIFTWTSLQLLNCCPQPLHCKLYHVLHTQARRHSGPLFSRRLASIHFLLLTAADCEFRSAAIDLRLAHQLAATLLGEFARVWGGSSQPWEQGAGTAAISAAMEWIKKHLPGGGGTSAPIADSDTWMGSTSTHKGEKGASILSAPEDDAQDEAPRREIGRSQSFVPPSQSATEIARSMSLGSALQSKVGSTPLPKMSPTEEGDSGSSSDGEGDDDAPLEAREECLVTVPEAIVHLVDEDDSPHLATGHLSLVRIVQKGNGIVVVVRVGENLHWPLMQDVPTVKLDPTHYFFSLPVPASVAGPPGHGEGEGSGLETLNYGVTFQNPKKHAKELQQLDKLLAQYSSFSSPKLLQGDEQKEELSQKIKEMSLKEKEKEVKRDDHGGKVVPKEVLSSDGKKMVVTEENQAAFWTTMAPNVDDYGSSAARAIANGSGQIIRGIFWVRDSTVSQLESGTIYMKSKINPGEKPSNISPRTLRNLTRVRNMSRATEGVAKGVLVGIVTTVGFFSGSIIQSRAGKKIFKLMPGEVALVSLDAFGKLFDAMEKATSDVLQSTSLMTENVVAHKFGESAGQVTQDTIATAGHVVATAWTVAKLRNALNPKQGVKPLTKTGIVKGMAKNAIRGK